eukprot:CAMPEP_0183290578 /NCGR_PEP_ID=MMETSP0160_2-20130417/206_1 /TAXON_ID=2839 ORGANISM="Odontella Sinensis, Strain Grunow 1884" /NCGR_SAMPLE_ID=MMETSP0160_2 /ASSEMBLY_ACC=CAM_ASM_000250 /LENGTH=748 /DNA_ID=CAMNT_0025451209 /DNA_START=98 /DNA_END=2344 /DNA_ORIENTATION=+
MAELSPTTHAVLKLRLDGNGGTRRVAFARLWDDSKLTVTYERLRTLAIEYSCPDGAPRPDENYEVVVTYLDEDGDTITISTDEELTEAFLQFVDQQPPVLRASATVKRNKKPIPKVAPAAPASPKAAGTPPPRPRSAPPSRQPSSAAPINQKPPQQPQQQQGPAPGQTTKQLQTILESFVSVLASAVVALQSHVAAEPPRAAGAGSPTVMPASITAVATPKAAERARAHSRSPSPASRDQKATEQRAKENKNEKKPETEKKEKKTYPVPEGFDPKFIHGRHTCDGCLCTPIIGIRYHATNLPDYDLCQNCIGNYQGNSIEFEPSELDRDRPLQLRWQRRQERRQGRSNTSLYPGCRFGARQQPSRRPCGSSEPMDFALKEAIRRSLLDANVARVSKTDTEQVQNEKPEKDISLSRTEEGMPTKMRTLLDAPLDNDVRKTEPESVVVDEKVEKDEPEVSLSGSVEHTSALVAEVKEEQEEKSLKEEVQEISAAEVESVHSEDFDDEMHDEENETSSPAPSKSSFADEAEDPIAKAIGAALDQTAEAINDIFTEFDIPSSNNAPAEEASTRKDAAEAETPSLVADSVSALSISIPSVEASVAHMTIDAASVNSEPEIVADPSNSGLELSSEKIPTEDAVSMGSEPELVSDLLGSDMESPEEEKPEELVPEPEGSFIFESDDSVDKAKTEEEAKNESSDDDWSVVDEDAQRDAQAANDEMLARAAELIGSALFQSDMSASASASVSRKSDK